MASGAYAKKAIRDKLIEHKQYIAKHGEDLPEIRNWKWKGTEQTSYVSVDLTYSAR